MKKIVALLMTAVMTIGMATAAFAAPSPQPTTGTIVAGKNASGQNVDLSKVKTSDNYSTNDAPGVEKIKANPQSVLKDAVGAANANGYGLAYVTNITADSDVQFPLTLTFKVNGVNSTSKVVVLRYVNGQWVQINGVVGDGNVTVTVDGASPIAFYVLNTNAASGNNGANGANGTDGSKVVSPKTGSAPVMMCVVAVAVAAAAGMCVTSRRKRNIIDALIGVVIFVGIELGMNYLQDIVSVEGELSLAATIGWAVLQVIAFGILSSWISGMISRWWTSCDILDSIEELTRTWADLKIVRKCRERLKVEKG